MRRPRWALSDCRAASRLTWRVLTCARIACRRSPGRGWCSRSRRKTRKKRRGSSAQAKSRRRRLRRSWFIWRPRRPTASAGKFFRPATMRFICSTPTARSAPCIARMAGRRNGSPSSSRAHSALRSRRSNDRRTCFRGTRCEMAIVYDKLMALQIAPAEQAFDAKDCMLYALGIGLGHDPMNEDELAFVYEKNLKVLPTMGAILGHPGFWIRDRDTGIDWVRIVNGEQGVTLHQPLKGQNTVIGRQRIVEVIDKGAGKGALVLTE